MTWEEIASLEAPAADARIAYGAEAPQFGDLRLPWGAGPHPLAIVVHGGCWRAANDLEHVAPLAAALGRLGVATWTLEYRRIGDPGGGWTGTFDDVAAGVEFVRTLARRHPLDLARAILLGHSAGGHLALWLAGRGKLPAQSPLASRSPGSAAPPAGNPRAAAPLRLRGVVALAAIGDLGAYAEGRGYCPESVAPLLGGARAEVPERYAQASPSELLPLGLPFHLVHGALDRIVPVEQSVKLAERARARGDDASLRVIDAAGHFDLIAPFAPAWAAVEQAVLALLA